MIKTVCKLAGIPALVIAGFAVSPLSSASAAADIQTTGSHAAASDPESCTYGSSNGNVHTCMSWSNSGTHIYSIDGTAEVINVPRTITVCVRSDVLGTIKCNPEGYIRVGPGGHIAADWSPNATEPAGTYCVRTWRQNDDGSHTLIGEVCTVIS